MCTPLQPEPQAAAACTEKKKKLSAKSIHAHVCVGTAIYNSIVFICLFIDLDLIFY